MSKEGLAASELPSSWKSTGLRSSDCTPQHLSKADSGASSCECSVGVCSQGTVGNSGSICEILSRFSHPQGLQIDLKCTDIVCLADSL